MILNRTRPEIDNVLRKNRSTHGYILTNKVL